MEHKSILYSNKLRIVIGLFAGFLIKALTDNVLALMYRNYNVLDSGVDILLTLLFSVVLFQAFYASICFFDKKYNWNVNILQRFLLQVFVHFFSAVLLFVIYIYFAEYFYNENPFFILKNVLINLAIVILIVIIYNFIELGYFLNHKWRFSLAELEKFKKENVEFRFETLKNQVNPHFLFNSLNTLSSLIYENQDTASQYIRELAKVYRYVLENRDKEMVKLRTDFEFIRSFIYLYELRFANMLSFDIDISDEKMDCSIAPMTIQMLIENAAKHNIVSRKKPLTISIKTEGDYVVIKNNLQLKMQKEFSSGMGLKNIKSRYSFISDKEVIIEETEDEFIVKIPLISRQSAVSS